MSRIPLILLAFAVTTTGCGQAWRVTMERTSPDSTSLARNPNLASALLDRLLTGAPLAARTDTFPAIPSALLDSATETSHIVNLLTTASTASLDRPLWRGSLVQAMSALSGTGQLLNRLIGGCWERNDGQVLVLRPVGREWELALTPTPPHCR